MKRISVISIVLSLIMAFSSFVCYAESVQDASAVLKTARNKLVFSVLSDEKISEVTKDLYLPAKWEGTSIYWTSNNETLLRVDGEKGVISRPPFGDGLACVVLSAHIGYQNQSVTKNFMVRISEAEIGRNCSASLAKVRNDFDKAFLSKQNLLAVRNNLIIPEVNADGITVTYVSENPDVISSEGVVTRDMQEDKIADFVVNFTYGYERTRLSYPIVVKAMSDNEVDTMLSEDLNWVMSNLQSNHKLDKLIENLSLSLTGPNGSQITYSSNNIEVLDNNGNINPSDSIQDVKLTITVTLRGQQLSGELNIKVLAQNSYDEFAGGSENSGGGIGGGGGSTSVSGGSGNVVMQLDKLGYNENLFNDVDNSHWATDAIRGLKDKGIVSGDGDGDFRPNDVLTREELVKMVILSVNAFVTDGYVNFSDVPVNHWSYYYISSAFSQGLISGRGDGTFGLGCYITRQDAAVIIYNTLVQLGKHIDGDGNTAFADMASISNYATGAVSALEKMGLINGKGNNMYMPFDNLTRAEGAAMIWRMLQK